jgi:hypothetical protein
MVGVMIFQNVSKVRGKDGRFMTDFLQDYLGGELEYGMKPRILEIMDWG